MRWVGEDRILMRETQLLGAVIADVEGRVNHLSAEEVDQLLQRAETTLRPSNRRRNAQEQTEPTVEDGNLSCG